MTTTKTREEVESELAKTKDCAEAAHAAVQSAERLYEELLRQEGALLVALRVLDFEANATVTKDLFEPFAMSDPVSYRLREGDRVQAEKDASEFAPLYVTRQDGRRFEVQDEFVRLDSESAAKEPA